MNLKFFSKDQSAFGLDISGDSFKMLQLKLAGGKTTVQCYSEVDIPKGLVINHTITDLKTFEYLARQMILKPQFGKVSTPYGVISLPESKAFVRIIQIPIMSEHEAESAVPFEAESFIPLPLDQVYMDWNILGTSGGKMDVLIAAIPKDYVDTQVGILEKIGIRPVALEVESFSCQRALVNPDVKETLMIVDIGGNRMNLVIVEEGNLQFTSTVPIAGNAFTETIARSLGVSSQKAETIKRSVGIENTIDYPNLKTSLLPILNNVSAEMKNILKFHSEHSQKPVQKIILSGGSAKLKNLIEFLRLEFSENPSMLIELGNPWLNVKNLQNSPLDAYQGLRLTTAIGLALRGMQQ